MWICAKKTDIIKKESVAKVTVDLHHYWKCPYGHRRLEFRLGGYFFALSLVCAKRGAFTSRDNRAEEARLSQKNMMIFCTVIARPPSFEIWLKPCGSATRARKVNRQLQPCSQSCPKFARTSVAAQFLMKLLPLSAF